MEGSIAPFDHVLAVAFSLGFPLVTGPAYLRRKASLERGDAGARRREYLETIAWLSSMGVATLVFWLIASREFGALGLGLSTAWTSGAAFGLAIAVAAFLAWQARTVARDPAALEAAREALSSVREYFPRTSAEARLFRGVSISAGIGEEIYYRGFLIWYLTHYMPVIGAVGVSSIVFGFAHWMHGFQATARSTVMGVVLAGLYLLGGSLWPAMILHTAVDLSSGATGRAAFRDQE